MTWGAPGWLWTVPCLALGVLGWLRWGVRRRRRALQQGFRTPLLGRLTDSVSPARRWFKHGLLGLGIAVLGVALARPGWGPTTVTVEQHGVDLVVALDVSRSMLAADVEGTNRLEAARAAVRELVARLGGDRVGLVLFAGEAFLAAPLTRDHAAVERALAALDPASISEPGSDLGQAIERARGCFDRAAQGSRALVLVTDGEQVRGDAVLAAARAQAAGIQVHAAAVGSARGARVPGTVGSTPGAMRNALGREVISRRDDALLRRVTAAGGGRTVLVEARRSRALAEWFEATAAALPRTVEQRVSDELQERFQWPLAIALVLLVVEAAVSDRRRPVVAVQRPPGLPVALVTLVLGWSSGAVAARGDAWTDYNAGVAAYGAGDFETADRHWQDASARAVPKVLRVPLWFQIGNVRFRLGEPLVDSAPEQAATYWREALESYRAVLRQHPRHTGGRANLRLVQRHLARLLQRLARELTAEAGRQELDRRIDLLRLGLDHLHEAQPLVPEDATLASELTSTAADFREQLRERSRHLEREGDEATAVGLATADRRAEREYRRALGDLDELRGPAARGLAVVDDPALAAAHAEAAESAARITRKLADLLARQGAQERERALEALSYDVDEAQDHYDAALERFEAALGVDPRHDPATQGRRQVLDEMEQLQMREGRRHQESGLRALPTDESRAVGELTTALSHFESALALNPANAEAQARAEAVRRLLPDLRVRRGQQAMTAGERAEPESALRAADHYEEARSEFERALESAPWHQPAREGADEASRRLERLRQRLQQEATPSPPSPGSNPSPRTLEEMLGEVRNPDRDQERERDRQRQAGRIQTAPRRVYPDW